MSAIAAARRGDFTANPRILVLTAMAVVIGVISGFVALALARLISFFTNVFYHGHLTTRGLASPAGAADDLQIALNARGYRWQPHHNKYGRNYPTNAGRERY